MIDFDVRSVAAARPPANITEAARRGLLFGTAAALILTAGVGALPAMVPGYNVLRQTVSEIGEVGSPAQGSFTVVLLSVALCLLIFAWSLRQALRDAGCSSIPAWFVGCTAISAAGVGWFSFPHPLHNVFGMSELIGYQAPFALAVACRRAPRDKGMVVFSWLMGVLVWIAIAANLSVIDTHGAFWTYERPVFGLVQRALFGVWFFWCAAIGVWLYRRTSQGQ